VDFAIVSEVVPQSYSRRENKGVVGTRAMVGRVRNDIDRTKLDAAGKGMTAVEERGCRFVYAGSPHHGPYRWGVRRRPLNGVVTLQTEISGWSHQ